MPCQEYLRLLTIPAPTEKDKKRPVLAKYINQYTARNTMDYFIHKDLGGFLRRELDFYIKNEVMRLDDIEDADAPAVESYLAKIRMLRKIAGKLIDFLAQLEDFQKKLWLKKKFVVETNYCVTLDRVPEELYADIAANEAQREEWVRLFAIDEIETDLHNKGYSKPLTPEFLKSNTMLTLDTRFFDENFKAKLLASIENLDDQCEGLLIQSENFQALNLLRTRYQEQVKCIYIDPPYNTAASEILYKNEYKHSSWLSLIDNTLAASKTMLSSKYGVFCGTIDDVEYKEFGILIGKHYGSTAGSVSIRIKPSGRPIPNGFAISHEYAIFAKPNPDYPIARLGHSEDQKSRYKEADENGPFFWEMFRKAGSNSNRFNRPTMYYPFYLSTNLNTLRFPDMKYDEKEQTFTILETEKGDEIVIYPTKDDGSEGCWYFGLERAKKIISEFKAKPQDGGLYRIYYRRRPNTGVQPTTLWFDFKDSIVLDYFAGSGTTGHAVIKLNREDSGNRKYILVEMGDYFDTVLKPRIAKVIYSESWKNGKPTARHTGISHCFKYIRLESYEDTLNNLRLDENPERNRAISANATLKEDYMLRYLLDVETRGSQSLLNIDAFADPTAYTLDVKKSGSDEVVTRNVDLIETFNFLIGLRVVHMAAPQEFLPNLNASSTRKSPKIRKPNSLLMGKWNRSKRTTDSHR